MRIKISLLFILFTSLLFGQFPEFDISKVSNRTREIVYKIEKINMVQGIAVGIAGTKPKQYENYEDLEKTANIDELIELSRHPNASVRSYAFSALAKHNNVDLYPIVLEHLQDFELVNTQFGCVGSRETVGDYFLKQIIYFDYPDFEDDSIDWANYEFEEKPVSKLNEEELSKINQMILQDEASQLKYRNLIIENLEASEENYHLIRDIYLKENNQDALLKLAEFHKRQDIPLIIANKDLGSNDGKKVINFKAVSIFPDESFLPFLENELSLSFTELLFDDYQSVLLYYAIAQYKNEKSFELMNSIYRKVTDELSKTASSHKIKSFYSEFSNVLNDNYDPIYNDLIFDIWENHNVINFETFEQLVQTDPKRTYENTVKYLTKSQFIQPINFTPVYNESIFEKIDGMYRYILGNDQKAGQEIIISQINNGNFNMVSDIIEDTKNPIYVEPMFRRLEKEWNAHVYLKLVSVLIEFNKPEINQRIIQTKKINSNLTTGWGSKKLDEILFKNNIR